MEVVVACDNKHSAPFSGMTEKDYEQFSVSLHENRACNFPNMNQEC